MPSLFNSWDNGMALISDFGMRISDLTKIDESD